MSIDPQDPTLRLIARCLTGEQPAYAALYDLYASGLYRLCYSLVLNAQDAEDVMQDSFVYAFKNLHRYDRQRASFKTWLYTIAVSRCRNTYRRKQPTLIDISQMFGFDIAAPDDDSSPEAASAHQAARDAIQHALVQLSPPLREAVVLRYGQGLTFREIAEIMDCPLKTAESRVRLAHDRLRALLSETGGRGLLDELTAY
ncbi:MAG: sigma-70 family RNA polymerase sigma factor [Anaerolineae bacterium]|jgi:RNA polymerase sigma-70 factor (ECF subfamily)|nr:sigma-70 family RNA polymerase sigma factor [Anaerolineae bacterium]